MKSKLTTALTLLLALVFVVSSFAGCANGGEGTESGSASGSDATDSGSETSEIANAKEELGKVDWGGKEFGILLYDGFSGEVKAEDGVVDKEGGNSQVINDAVYTRNNLLESECGLKFNWVIKPADQATKAISTEATVPTGEFYLIDYRLRETAQAATSGYLHDFINMGIDLDKSWWDTGTADFALNQKVYFMCGDVNFVDDDFTYVLIFNKKMPRHMPRRLPIRIRPSATGSGRWIISTRSFRAFPPITETATGMRTIPTALSRRGSTATPSSSAPTCATSSTTAPWIRLCWVWRTT